MLMFILLFTSIFGAETGQDWCETKHELEVYDCSVSLSLHQYSVPEECLFPEQEEEAQVYGVPGWVLGEEYVHAISSVVCAATISHFRGYCRAYLHWKFMDVLEIEASKEVSLDECRRASLRNEYQAGDGKFLRVTPGDSVLYQFLEDGSITVNSYNTYCQGVNLQLHHSQVVQKSLFLTQFRFSLTPETFLRSRARNMVAQLDQVSLPTDCRAKNGGCLSEDWAYLFQEDTPSRPLRTIRQVQLQQEGEKLLIDHQLGLLFNVTTSQRLEI